LRLITGNMVLISSNLCARCFAFVIFSGRRLKRTGHLFLMRILSLHENSRSVHCSISL